MRAYTDGACRRSNPGVCSCAFVILNADGTPHASLATYLGPELHTNNYAEYQGLLLLLRWAQAFGHKNLDIYCDSKLVVEQVNGGWKINNPDLLPFCTEAYALMVVGRHLLHHIKGHSGDPGNEYVDHICNEILDKEMGITK
jgi:ribonuclease HI